MEYSQLRAFLETASRGTISRAAEALSVTQPAVTHQIRALERELGTRLFDRTGRGVLLTPAGQALLEHARESLRVLEEGRRAAQEVELGTAGRMTVGAGVTTCIFHLPGYLRAFREAFPSVAVQVRTGRSREIAGLVAGREIEFGLVTSAAAVAGLAEIPLWQERIVMVASPAVPWDAPAEIPLILFPQGTGFREYLDRTLSIAGHSPRVALEIDSAEAVKRFVEAGLGASFLPEAAVRDSITAGTLVELSFPALSPMVRQTSLLRIRARRLSGAARGLIDILRTGNRVDGSDSVK
jgi:DNA-binding transcriptional LysR family regulator